MESSQYPECGSEVISQDQLSGRCVTIMIHIIDLSTLFQLLISHTLYEVFQLHMFSFELLFWSTKLSKLKATLSWREGISSVNDFSESMQEQYASGNQT